MRLETVAIAGNPLLAGSRFDGVESVNALLDVMGLELALVPRELATSTLPATPRGSSETTGNLEKIGPICALLAVASALSRHAAFSVRSETTLAPGSPPQ